MRNSYVDIIGRLIGMTATVEDYRRATVNVILRAEDPQAAAKGCEIIDGWWKLCPASEDTPL